MIQIKLIIAALFLVSPFVANADPITVTGTTSSDGVWDVTLVEGSWDELRQRPDGSRVVVGHDRLPALVFAETTDDLFGYINYDTYGPFFGFDPSAFGVPDTLAACHSDGCDLFTGAGETTYFWATASRVPEPGTLALFGIGLAGMGFSRRKKKV